MKPIGIYNIVVGHTRWKVDTVLERVISVDNPEISKPFKEIKSEQMLLEVNRVLQHQGEERKQWSRLPK